MGKKLLIVNTYANLWSTGRIAAEIGEIAVKHGWQCYFAYASESNLCSCEEIRINKSVISYIIHTRFFQKREKKWQIQKILMNIMQMNYIGSYFLYFSDK